MKLITRFRETRPWQMASLFSALIMVLAMACGAAASSEGSEAEDASSQQAEGQAQSAPREIPVNGSLVFPRRVELTFDTNGEVGEILVNEGDRVTQGQVLARLDALRITALESELAQAEFDLDAAEEALERARKAEFINSPLEQAEFEDQVARARKTLEDAAEKLTDFQRNYQSDRALAMRAQADAEKEVDDAVESLGDFQRDHLQSLADAMQVKALVEEEVDQALRNVGHFERDRVQELADARQLVADMGLVLDQAREDLINFNSDFDEELGNAVLDQAKAEDALELAEDNLELFRRDPSRDFEAEKRIDVEALRRLEVAVEEARTNLQRARDKVSQLQNNRSLKEAERQAAVPMSEAALVKASNDLADLEREVDGTLNLQMRRASLELAQAKLVQAEVDLQEEMEGPDLLILQQLEAVLESSQAKLAQAEADLQEEMVGPDQAELAVRQKEVALAREKLEDLIGPDLFDVALKEAQVGAAKAKVDDALDELEGAIIRSPIDGIVTLVNVEIEDIVNDESRVLEVTDPTQVEVDGLVDAIDIQLVREGANARVSIAALPAEEFRGTVTRLAEEPRTERGVVSYAVRITLDLPEGLAVPTRLSSVNTVIISPGAGS